MVNEPEYPSGLPLFEYIEGGRRMTVCLTYPEDGTPPLPLAELRELVAKSLEQDRQASGPNVRFLEQWLEAMDFLIASRAAGKLMGTFPPRPTQEAQTD